MISGSLVTEFQQTADYSDYDDMITQRHSYGIFIYQIFGINSLPVLGDVRVAVQEKDKVNRNSFCFSYISNARWPYQM